MKKTLQFIFINISFITVFTCCTANENNTSLVSSQSSGIILSASVVTSSDKLVLHYPKKHPSKLAIQDPNLVWYVIQEAGTATSLMSDSQFSDSTSLAMQIDKVTGITWVDGEKVQKKVFSVPGKYLIYMADNLETEPENTFYFSTTLIYK